MWFRKFLKPYKTRGSSFREHTAKQVGELSKWVMYKEKYYAFEENEETVNMRLGNEMADVIAQVIRLADVYNIDLEKAYIEAREDEARYLDSRGV